MLPVQLQGRRWYSVPHLGYLTSLLTGQQRGLLMTLVVAGLLGYALAMFRGALRSRRTPQAPVAAVTAELSTADGTR